MAENLGFPMLQVQHHYAHVLSCMTENDCQEPVIGVSFDGTGYGTDGTIWGGEILLADYQDFTRFGSITPFLQIGGDASAKEGWRIAVSMIYGYTKNREKAWEIIERWVDNKPVHSVSIPMHGAKQEWQAAHQHASEQICELLEEYETVAYPVLGDPGIYSSGSYLIKYISAR